MAGHLTLQEREVLYRLQKAGKSKAEMAATLGRDRSTIYRELRRNKGGRGYRPQQAQRKAEERRLGCRPGRKLAHTPLKNEVTRKLKLKWSPDVIAGWLKSAFPRQPVHHVSHQTIYNWLVREAPELRVHLRRGRRRSRPETRGKIPHAVSIKGRPKSVDAKRRYGHWEGDTVVSPGRRSGLVTLVERKSKYVRIRKTASLKSPATMRAAKCGLRDLPLQYVRSLTFDNGKEFAQHHRLTEALDLDIYFAEPYASWQRGLNENTNGLLRQFFPKGTDFARISRRQVARVEKLLNERPRKSLDYKTPSEVFAQLCCN